MRSRLGRTTFFQPDFVLPGNIEVVFVEKRAAIAQLQGVERDIGGCGRRFPRAVTDRVHDELIKVDALPAHRDLENAVKFP